MGKMECFIFKKSLLHGRKRTDCSDWPSSSWLFCQERRSTILNLRRTERDSWKVQQAENEGFAQMKTSVPGAESWQQDMGCRPLRRAL